MARSDQDSLTTQTSFEQKNHHETPRLLHTQMRIESFSRQDRQTLLLTFGGDNDKFIEPSTSSKHSARNWPRVKIPKAFFASEGLPRFLQRSVIDASSQHEFSLPHRKLFQPGIDLNSSLQQAFFFPKPKRLGFHSVGLMAFEVL